MNVKACLNHFVCHFLKFYEITAVFHEFHGICQTQIELSQQLSVFVYVSDWLLKYINSSDECSRVCEEFV